MGSSSECYTVTVTLMEFDKNNFIFKNEFQLSRHLYSMAFPLQMLIYQDNYFFYKNDAKFGLTKLSHKSCNLQEIKILYIFNYMLICKWCNLETSSS